MDSFLGKLSNNWQSKLIIFSSILTPWVAVEGAGAMVGVVYSQENASQWQEITQRLQSTKVDYCILDTRNWQSQRDLNNLQALFIPNVNNISPNQAQSLEYWLKTGGKIIASGPVGQSSPDEVKNSLKKILGAQWGYPMTSPSNLMPTATNLVDQGLLAGTLMGGIIIPENKQMITQASWSSNGNPPAVVRGENTTFFAWRWGIDELTKPEFDTAWLTKALQDHRIKLTGNSNPNPQPCQSALFPSPKTPAPSTPQSQAKPRTVATNVSNGEIEQMMAELSALTHRVENTLIKGEAQEAKYDQPMAETIAQMNQIASKNVAKTTPSNFRFDNTRAHQAVIQAQELLKNFPQLAKTNFGGARQQWLNARRDLWQNYPTDRNFAQPEVRAMWVDRGTIVKAKSKADLVPLFDRMAEAGINTVFFETINAGYPIYPSTVAPQQNPMTRGWDPLQASIELAHERKMELHAWAWIFAVANQGHNRLLGLPNNHLGPVLSRHPSWALKDKNGNMFNRTPGFQKAFVDPANPEVRRYLQRVLREIAQNYNVDGIQFDYIRYPFQDSLTKQQYGYTDSARWLFKQKYGVDPQTLTSSSPLWSQWAKFRIEQVDSFVIETSQQLKDIKPNLTISTAVFPMERNKRLWTLQQNWESWIANNSVDLMVLMTYALDTGSFENRVQSVNDYSLTSNSLILPGIRLLKVPHAEALDQMQLLRNLPSSGFALFASEHFDQDLERILVQTQGRNGTKTPPIPHRQPFATAAVRYRALQQEWNFLLLNDKININPSALQDWATSADTLRNDLDMLAKSPNTQNLQQAKRSLVDLRNSFPTYLQQHNMNNVPQGRSWSNRLITIENLLNYGEVRKIR